MHCMRASRARAQRRGHPLPFTGAAVFIPASRCKVGAVNEKTEAWRARNLRHTHTCTHARARAHAYTPSRTQPHRRSAAERRRRLGLVPDANALALQSPMSPQNVLSVHSPGLKPLPPWNTRGGGEREVRNYPRGVPPGGADMGGGTVRGGPGAPRVSAAIGFSR